MSSKANKKKANPTSTESDDPQQGTSTAIVNLEMNSQQTAGPSMVDMVPILNSQAETLKSFVESQQASMRELTNSLKIFTGQHVPPDIEAEHVLNENANDNDQQQQNDAPAGDDAMHFIQQWDEDNGGETEEELSDEVKNMLEEIQSPNDFGEALSTTTANTFLAMMKLMPSKETLDQLKATYKAPENCKVLASPSVNQSIWSGLPMNAKTVDAKNQTLHHLISRSLVAQGRLMDLIMKNVTKDKQPTLLRPLLDSAKALALASHDLSMKRRQSIKPFLKPECRQLCSPRIAVTTELFGDELDQNIKDVKSSSSVLIRQPYHHHQRSGYVAPTTHRHRFHPYPLPNRGAAAPAPVYLNYYRPPIPRGGPIYQPRFPAPRYPAPAPAHATGRGRPVYQGRSQ